MRLAVFKEDRRFCGRLERYENVSFIYGVKHRQSEKFYVRMSWEIFLAQAIPVECLFDCDFGPCLVSFNVQKLGLDNDCFTLLKTLNK